MHELSLLDVTTTLSLVLQQFHHDSDVSEDSRLCMHLMHMIGSYNLYTMYLIQYMHCSTAVTVNDASMQKKKY